ncbi:tripartite tricarboxylate transporter substrate binding protein [Ramlibacter sp. MAH-25]|uniref:Tripartite tricarboxylate transporter substrate binding protein n=2 Tax=Comamonadaceae TaxID=80864 RepID=A0A6N8J203_9BURK|nr:tripartite tricarboxylate transporter substrate binding protein [Ramlibacter pinisoli]
MAPTMKRRDFLLSGAALGALPAAAVAQSVFPAKPVTMVVVFPAGQAGDLLARVLSEPLSRTWGQQLIIDNKAGAAGIIGSAFVAKARPDGYTLLLSSTGPMAVAPHVYKKAGYDPLRDFTPIVSVGGVGYALVVPATSKFHSLGDLVSGAKATGRLNYASAGNGSTQHLMMELLKQRAGIEMTHVPYKGLAPAYPDLISGTLDVFFDTLPSVLPHLQSGKVRVLAVSTPERVPALPDVPTVMESGIPDFRILGWYGIAAPAKLDTTIRDKINADLRQVIATEAVRNSMAKLGIVSMVGSPDDFAKYLASEYEKFGDIIRKANITVE